MKKLALLQFLLAVSFILIHGDSLYAKEVVVAVIDTGIDVNHPALSGRLWENPGETGLDSEGRNKATNGIDDDDNGFVDDIHGWNFVSKSSNLKDRHGHGTHIAGIIAGLSPQSPSVNTDVKLMIVKYFDPNTSGRSNLMNTVQAINYAVKMGADIINYSGGGTDPSPSEKLAIEKAAQKGIVFIAAAGNESANTDLVSYYPANYKINNIISVAAVDATKQLLNFSNYGADTIDLAAPGKNIYSTLPGGKFGVMSGTSQATAIVSSLAARLMAEKSQLTRHPSSVLKSILHNGSAETSLKGKTKYRVGINMEAAM